MVGREWRFQLSADQSVKPFLNLRSKTINYLTCCEEGSQVDIQENIRSVCTAINHNHNRPNKAIKRTLGAWTVLSSLSSLVCDYKMSCFVASWKQWRQGEMEREKEKGDGERDREQEWQSTGPGQGSVGRSDKVGGPSPGGCSSA